MASTRSPVLGVVGAGFLGREVARMAQAGGWEVIPVVRSRESAENLRREFPGVRAEDALKPDFWDTLRACIDGLVWTVAPSESGTPQDFESIQRVGAGAAATWVRHRKIAYVYVSSTSVYAEQEGAWVCEDSPLATEDPRAMAMVEAERATIRAGGTVLRCAGLYGKDRMPKPEGAGPERWLNLIHVEDAARAVAMALRRPGRVLNVCEDQPRRRGRPGGIWPETGRRPRRNKRVSNDRLRGLGWRPMAMIPDEQLKTG